MLKKIKVKKFVETEKEVEITFPIFRKYIIEDDEYTCTTYYYIHTDFHSYAIIVEEYPNNKSVSVAENKKFEIDNDFYYKKDGYEDSNEDEFLDAKLQCKDFINNVK